MVPELVPQITIPAEMMVVIVSLEQAVVFYDPAGFFGNIGSKDSGGHFAMGYWSEFVTDVMQQSGDYHLLGLTGIERMGSGLQGMLKAADLVTSQGMSEAGHGQHNTVR
jgi:hypothetical protein